jgi:hypothetical protein
MALLGHFQGASRRGSFWSKADIQIQDDRNKSRMVGAWEFLQKFPGEGVSQRATTN